MALYVVELTDRAQDHFRGHIGYILDHFKNPDAAWELYDAFIQAQNELADHPETAPLCTDPALSAFNYRRKMILNTRYLCICRIEGDIVWIEGVYHELQDYENLFRTGR